MFPIDPHNSPGNWGKIPTIKNDVESSVPDANGNSETQTVQSNAADAQQNLSVNLLPPAPNWVNPVDSNGKMSQPWMFWLELLRRRVGGSNTIPASDYEILGLTDVIPPPLFQQSAIDDLANLLDSGASDAYVSSLRNAIDGLAEQQALCCNDSGQQFARPLADAQTDALFSDPAPTQALAAQVAELQQLLTMVQEPGSFSTNFTGRLSTFTDNLFQVVGSSDPTKVMKFEVDGFTTATTRTLTPPDANIVISGSASALTSGRVPYVTTGGLLTDITGFTFSGADLVIPGGYTGNGTVHRFGNTAGATDFGIRAAAGSNRDLFFYTGSSSTRWGFRTGGAETGSDAGSNWAHVAYTDAGAEIDRPIIILRASAGTMTFGGSTARLCTFTGDINVASGKVYKVNSTQVVGARSTGWTAMTGANNKATAYDPSTITLVQLAERVSAIQIALTTHGLIGA